MMIRKILASLTLLLMFTVVFVPADTLAFNLLGNACGGAGSGSAVCQDQSSSDPLTGPNGLLREVTNIVAIVAGLASVVIIIVSGFQYIASGGDAQRAESAKKTLTYAIVGLIVIALSGSIISIVLSRI